MLRLANPRKQIRFGFKQPLVGEKRCVTTLITAAEETMYNKTIIRFGFCDIQNNRGLGKGYHNPYLDLDYSGYHKNLIQ